MLASSHLLLARCVLPIANRCVRALPAAAAAARSTRVRSPLHVRAFASSSRPPTDGKDRGSDHSQKRNHQSVTSAPTPSSWLEDAREAFARARARAHVLDEFNAHGVFQPSPSRLMRLSNWLIFYQLSRPRETLVDLVEFLEGAKHALETTMMAMYSREFAAFATSNTKNATPTDADRSSAVHRLRQSLEPVSFDAFTDFVSFSSAAGIRSELQRLELHSAHVVGVSFKRVPTRKTTNSSGALVAGVPTHERMAIDVLFDVTEHFRMTLPGKDGDEELAINEEEVVVRHNKAVWRFASNVTTESDIDWTIEPLELAAA